MRVGNAVAQVTQTADDANSYDAAGATFQDIILLSRLRRTGQDYRKFCAKFKLGLSRAKRHP